MNNKIQKQEVEVLVLGKLCLIMQYLLNMLIYASYSQILRRSSMHLGRNIAGSVGSYLPDVLTEIWEPSRDFAWLKLPSAGVRSLVALSRLVLFYKH
jgi:hypothetical protein